MTFVEYVKVALHVIILLNKTAVLSIVNVIMSIIVANSVLMKIGQTILICLVLQNHIKQ